MIKDPEIVQWGKQADQPLSYLTAEEFNKSQDKAIQLYMKNIEAVSNVLR